MVILISHLLLQRTQGIPCAGIGIAAAGFPRKGIDRDIENSYYSQMEHEDGPDKDRKPVAQPGTRPVPRISSRDLMRQQSELIIEHDGREYRLRITQSGKLILTA
jgi:hemin uptake protein HemP